MSSLERFYQPSIDSNQYSVPRRFARLKRIHSHSYLNLKIQKKKFLYSDVSETGNLYYQNNSERINNFEKLVFF